MVLRRITLVLLGLYALLTAYSVVRPIFGWTAPHFFTTAITLTGFSFALLHAGQREGWNRALRLLGLVLGVSLLFECVGVATGLVYGPYHYTAKLGPLFLGLVPYLIPVAWFMMSYPSFVIADRLIPSGWRRWQRILGVAAVGGLAMTAWDLVMDPVMVAGGHWIWDVNGAYHGIPLQNFWGWWLTVFVTYALYLLLAGKREAAADPGSDRLPLLSYLITALGITLGSFVSGSGELGLIGTFAMLPWVVAGWLKLAPAGESQDIRTHR
jgi:putative membrane protein